MATLDIEAVDDRMADWLESNGPAQRRKVLATLMRTFNQAWMQDGGKPIAYATLPYFLPQPLRTDIQVATKAILDALMLLESKALADDPSGPLYQHLLGNLDPDGIETVRLPFDPSADSALQRFRRFDGHVGLDGVWRMIETNQVGPRGMTWRDESQLFTARLLSEMGVEIEVDLVTHAMADWLVLEYQQRYGFDKFPHRIAVSVEETYSGITSEIPPAAKRMQRYLLERYGERVEFILASPCNFHTSGDRMFAWEQEVDLVWYNTYTLQRHTEACRPPEDEYFRILRRPEDFLVVNHPARARLTRTKGGLPAIVWNDELSTELGLGPAELALLRRHVTETYHFDTNPDFRKEVMKQRSSLFFKPSDGGGGEGAFSGNNGMSDDELWEKLNSDGCVNYVAQRLVPPQELVLNHILPDTGELRSMKLVTDYSPYIIGGQVGSHALMRAKFSKDEILNLNTKNGGQGWVVPVF